MKKFSFLVVSFLLLLTGCTPYTILPSVSPAPVAEEDTKTESPEPQKNAAGFVVRETLPMETPTLSPEEATDVSLTIDKSEHTLTMYNGEEEIAIYSIGIGKKSGAKEKEGDKKTPEGDYYVCTRNDQSKFHLALGLSYPNAQDAQRGYEAGLISQTERDAICQQIAAGQRPSWDTALGGQIMIHGQKGDMGGECDWSTGCVSADNDVMDILWDYCPVGTPVHIIA